MNGVAMREVATRSGNKTSVDGSRALGGVGVRQRLKYGRLDSICNDTELGWVGLGEGKNLQRGAGGGEGHRESEGAGAGEGHRESDGTRGGGAHRDCECFGGLREIVGAGEQRSTQ